jgi:hypothetical protein
MSKRRYNPYAVLCLLVGLLSSLDGFAQSDGAEERAPDHFFALPIELDLDGGAKNGDATILKFAPLYRLTINQDWSLINLNLVSLADTPGGIAGNPGNPSPLPGKRVFGLGDLLHASFLTPRRNGNFILGFGGILSMPLATDAVLGSGKWSAGPAIRLTYRTGPWNVGFFGGNYWSFAGGNSRAKVNQFLVRGAIRRDLANEWYLVSAPVITANWHAESGQKWLVPLGGGFGKQFGPESSPWAVSVQAYVNIIKPDSAPDWALRIAIIAAIPLGE